MSIIDRACGWLLKLVGTSVKTSVIPLRDLRLALQGIGVEHTGAYQLEWPQVLALEQVSTLLSQNLKVSSVSQSKRMPAFYKFYLKTFKVIFVAELLKALGCYTKNFSKLIP